MRTYEDAKRIFENQKNRHIFQSGPEYSHIVKSLVTCFKERVEDGWYFNGEYHDSWEMLYVTKGHIFIQTDRKQTQKLEEGNLIFFTPMEFHRMWCKDCPAAKFIVISFCANDNELIRHLGDDVITPDKESIFELRHLYDFILEIFDVNFHVFTRPEAVRNTIGERLCHNRLEHFLLSILNSKALNDQRHLRISSMNYKLIIDTMVENINKNLTIEELASLCNMSVSNLKKTFGKYNNGGVMKYFNQLKINKSILFLKDGHSISYVAHIMGFSNPNYFSIVFKRETGMLPSEYKKKKL